MLSEMGVRAMISGGGEGFSSEDLGRELSLLLREQRRQESSDRERELNIYRSGSAPPTVEGSLTAMGVLFGSDAAPAGEPTEEDLRSHPDYVSYYYANVNLNPRLPPPVLSKEDWRFARRFQAGGSGLGGIGDRSKLGRIEEGGSRSLFSMQPGFSAKELDDEELRIAPGSSEWMGKGGDGLIGLPGLSLVRQRSFADLFQDDQNQRTSVSGHAARPASRTAYEDCVEPLRSGDAHLLDGIRASSNVQNVIGHQNNGSCATQTFASVVGSSLSRSNTPDPQLAARAPSPRLPPVGVKMSNGDKKSNASISLDRSASTLVNSEDLISALSGMKISNASEIDENVHSSLKNKTDDHQNFLFDLQSGLNNVKQHPFLQNSDAEHLNASSVHQSSRTSFPGLGRSSSSLGDFNSVPLSSIQHAEMSKTLSSNNSYPKGHSATMIGCSGGSPVRYPGSSNGSNASFTTYGLNGYAVNSLPSMISNQAGVSNLPPLLGTAGVAPGLGSPSMDARNLGGCFSSGINLNGASDLQNLNKIGSQAAASSLQLPLLDPLYIQYLNAEQASSNYHDPLIERGFMSNSYADLLGIQKAYLGALLQPQKQFGIPLLGKSGYYGNSAFGLGVSYPGSPVASPIISSSVGPVSPLRHGERNMHFPTGMRNIGGNVMGSWHLDGGGSIHEGFASSLLEEFKNNKTKCYELSDIEGHVVEFSADQYGSRFIQQKLESATAEEKAMVFSEIMPHAFSLMTDVFGNYVVQKFFEHGSSVQRRELADQLTGHVLALSLQMYGCRVIQKAIEVVDLDQQTKMVQELDGHVMRCVRDQNGNHVIQKCIECIPQDAIQFIVSTFYDQVVTLSTHPYGCRVIQRVLEHCHDPKTQQIMMDEILQSVCMLAQDQYGNYVVQHVLEHGKPHERSAIIEKLAGQIVQMSQQKFASNVVEKCLTFGGPEERQLLVNEMLGATDENEPLQAMMKDQFANYVVQKVLETCDDQQRELILSRIKVHLNALKKYTYGKHIVARVEKLVAAGERRIGVQPSYA